MTKILAPKFVAPALMLLALAAASAASMICGAENVAVGVIAELMRYLLFGQPNSGQLHSEQLETIKTIVFEVRLARALVAGVAGAALAVAGVLTQGLLRNPLASPSVLGIEAGGALAAALAFFFLSATHWPHYVPVAASVGCLFSTLLLLALSKRDAFLPTVTLLLFGFALNALFGSVSALLVSLAMEDYQKVPVLMASLLGSFSSRDWTDVVWAMPWILIGFVFAWRARHRLDVVALGEEIATTLNVDLRKLRALVVTATALLVGAASSLGGALPFVGFVVPHFTRLLLGPHHGRLMAYSGINGMTLVLVSDLIARTARRPLEIPVGVIAALVGTPFFVWMLLKEPRP